MAVIALPDGGSLAYEVTAPRRRRTPVLLLRPLAGAMALWGGFRESLARRFRVIALDPRGTGGSSRAPLGATTATHARDAVALLDALDVPRAHVFGISFGAMVATALAAESPTRVARLVLASAGPRGTDLAPTAVAEGAAMVEAVLRPEGEVLPALVEAVMGDGARPSKVAAAKAEAAQEPVRRIEIVKHAVTAARHDARDDLAKITAPTLVLAGGDDALYGTEGPRALADGIAGARFAVIEGAGHDLTLERPAETAAAVLAFLEGKVGRRGVSGR